MLNARNHEIITHQVDRLQREHGITTAEAYDALLTSQYDMDKAGQLVTTARECGMSLAQLLASITPTPNEVR